MTVTAFQQANQLLREGKLEDAIIAYQSAITQHPNFYLYYHNLGEALERLGRFEEAITAYQHSVELKPEAAWSVFELGKLLLMQERFEGAVFFLQRTVELKSDVAEFNLALEAALGYLTKKNEAKPADTKEANVFLVAEHLEDALHESQLYDNPHFCEQLYLQLDGNVAKAVSDGHFQSGLDHWLKCGRFEDVEGKRQRIPGYIENIYLRDNPDVAHSVNLGIFNSGYEHFLLYGWYEKRSLESFQINLEKCRQDVFYRLNIRDSIRKVELLELKPTISIIVPVFNTERNFLESCIDSVINQIYPHWELCLVDDGSHKSFIRDVLLNYQKLDSRIKVKFLEKNSGI